MSTLSFHEERKVPIPYTHHRGWRDFFYEEDLSYKDCGIIDNMNKARTLYIDESGKASFRHQSDCFILSGCSILSTHKETIRQNANNIIFKYWGSQRSYSRKYGVKNIVFRANDIAGFNGPFTILRDSKTNRNFWNDIYSQILSDNGITYYISLVDKQSVHRNPNWKPSTTLRKTYTSILSQFIKHLKHSKITGRIIAESSYDQDTTLVTVFNSLSRNSRRLYRSATLVSKKITSLSLVNKHDNDIGAQIADLMAWTGQHKYLVDNKTIDSDNLEYQKKKLLNLFNRRIKSRAARHKFNFFEAIK